MGMAHMKQVWTIWGELPDKPFRALLYIAMRLPDTETSPLWFGAPDEVAIAIGELSRIDGPQRKTVLRKVSTVMSQLVDAGALVLVQRAAPGRRATYGLQTSMERARYSRDRSTDGRRSNGREKITPTVAKTSRTLDPPHCPPGLGLREDKRNGVVPAQPLTPRRTRPELRSIDGGRPSNAPDDPARQPPLLGLVTGDAAESVGAEHEREAL